MDRRGNTASADRQMSVLIVDDHQSFGDLLTIALSGEPDFRVCGVARDADEAVVMSERLSPDLILMDIQLSPAEPSSGLAATRRIRHSLPDVVIVVATAHRDPQWISRAAAAGADGFVPKSGSLEQMLSVLRQARRGAVFLAPSVLPPSKARAVARAGDGDSVPRMTSREVEVLRLIATGLSPAQAAHVLQISVHTCRGYLKSIHSKLGVSSQLQAVVRARDLGVLDTPG